MPPDRLQNSPGSVCRILSRTRVRPAPRDQKLLTHCDDERRIRRTYTYAELAQTVDRLANVLQHARPHARGDRIATLLFNDDLTVLDPLCGLEIRHRRGTHQPDESTERKRYIRACGRHSRSLLAGCSPEITDLQATLPALREVVAFGDRGLLDLTRQSAGGRRHDSLAPPRPRPRPTTPRPGADRVHLRHHRAAQKG